MFTVTEKIIKKKGVFVWYLPVLTVWNPSVLSLSGCRGARDGLPGNGGNVWAQQRWRSMRKSKLLEEELSGNVWLYLHFICNL